MAGPALAKAAGAATMLAFALAPAPCAAEKFIPLGTQPDGAHLYVQAAPPTILPDGRRQGWFRTVPKAAESVTDELGVEQQYTEMLGLNVADCKSRVMGSASMTYRDASGTVVAQFELPPKDVELVKVRANTLGDAMFAWLCAARGPVTAPPLPSATTSPFK
jgi:hypothetical protein